MRPPSLLRNVLLVSLLTWLPAAMANPNWWVRCWKSNNCQSCETGGGKYGPVVDLYKFSWEWDAAAKAYDKAAYEQGLNGKTCQVGMYIPLENADGTLGITESQYKAGSLKFEGVSDAEVQKETIGGQQMPKYVPGDKTATFPHPDTDTNGYGFGVDQYFNDQTTPTPGQGGTVQTCAKPGDDVKPLTESTCGMPRYNEGQEPPPIGVLDIVTSKPHPVTGEMIAKSVRYTAPVGSPSWKIEWFDGNTKTATSVLKPHKVEEITRLQMKTGHGQTEKVRRVTKLAAAPGQDPTQVQSDVTETHAFYKFGFPVVLERVVHHGNGQPDTTTTWTYYTNPNDPVSFNKPATMRSSSGAWANYSYQGSEVTGSVLTKTITPWLDSPAPAVGTAPDESTCRVVTTLEALKETGTFFREEKVLGQVVASMSGERFKEGNILVERIKEKTGTGPDLVTTRRGFANNELVAEVERGRLQSVTRSDGTVEKYSHKKSGSNRVEVIERGTGTAGGVTAGTKIESTYSQRDYLLEQKTSDIGCAMPLDTRTAIGFDYYGNPMKWAHDNDPSDYSETTPGCCCGPERERNRDGTVTDHLYDPNKRPVMERNTCGNRVVTDTFDYGTTGGGMPRITETTVASGVEGSVVKTTVKDLGGRPVSITKPGPMGTPETTSYAYSADERITTHTNPDGGTIITETYLDGQIKSVTGTATIAKTYSYSVHNENGGGLVTTETTAGGVGGQTSSYSDLAGRTYKQTRTAPHGQTATTLTTYNAKGQAEMVTSSGQPGVRYIYNDLGERTGEWVDLNGDNLFNGDLFQDKYDFFSTVNRDYQPAAVVPPGMGDSRRTTESVRLENGDMKLLSTTWQSVDGLRSRKETLGIAGAAITIRTRPLNGTYTVEVTDPEGTSGKLEASILSDGRTRFITTSRDKNLAVIGTSTGHRDAMGRPLNAVDQRGNETTWEYRDNGGDILRITGVDAATDGSDIVTSYDYAIVPGVGRTNTTTLPDGGKQFRTADHQGRNIREWGHLLSPVETIYDALGKVQEQKTWKAPVEDFDPLAFPTSGHVTTFWDYDPSGVLLSKTLDDNTTTQYTYDIAGRLQTRQWARGVVTTCGYDHGGRLATIDYSDDTPDVTYTQDNLYRLGSMTQGTRSWTFAYDPATLRRVGEIHPIPGTQETRNLTFGYDTYARYRSITVGTASEPQGDHSAAWDWDAAGRLDRIWLRPQFAGDGSPTGAPSITHGYVAGTSLLATTTSPVHTATNTWETKRNVLESRRNETTTTTPNPLVSGFTYLTNTLGQATSVTTSGDAFGATPAAWSYGYDPLGQLETADSSADDRDRLYALDIAGNRMETTNGSGPSATTTTYQANDVNLYTVVNPMGAGPVQPVHDEDGNLRADQGVNSTGQAHLYDYDGENRLVRVRRASDQALIANYDYDPRGRRIRKTTTAIAPQGATDTAYVYDEWELNAEYTLANGAATLHAAYTWGIDHLGGGGGQTQPGSLLSVTRHQAQSTTNFYPTYDGCGNVSEYLDANGAVAAHFEYDPYGNVVASSGDIDAFPIRHATKPVDRETGFHYYGLRYYDPLSGRWTSRDPIGETGGRNLSAFVGNDPVNFSDLLGMKRFGQDGWDWGTCLCQFLSGLKSAGVAQIADTISGLDPRQLGAAFGQIEEVVMKIRNGEFTIIDLGNMLAPGITYTIQHFDGFYPDGYTEQDSCYILGTAGIEIANIVVGLAAGGSTLATKISGQLGKLGKLRKGKRPHGGRGDPPPLPNTPTPDGTHPDIPACFAAGTLVSGSAGSVPIESIVLGQRVATMTGESATAVQPDQWRKVSLRLESDDPEPVVNDIELLRPLEWLEANKVVAGSTVWQEYPELGIKGHAEVLSVEPCPQPVDGPGRVVTGTFRHLHPAILEIRLQGSTEPLRTTHLHPFFAAGRSCWIQAKDIVPGEVLRTRQGIIRVESLETIPGPVMVFNLEVETDHHYLVGHEEILVHNNGCLESSDPSGGGKPKDTKKFQTRRAALRQAKRDAGIPTSQTHTTHKSGLKADKLDSERTATEFYFEGGGQIQEHPKGHKFSDGGVNDKPHFNNHPQTKTHYEYENR